MRHKVPINAICLLILSLTCRSINCHTWRLFLINKFTLDVQHTARYIIANDTKLQIKRGKAAI